MNPEIEKRMHVGELKVERAEGDQIVEAYKRMTIKDFVADGPRGGAHSIDNSMTQS